MRVMFPESANMLGDSAKIPSLLSSSFQIRYSHGLASNSQILARSSKGWWVGEKYRSCEGKHGLIIRRLQDLLEKPRKG